MILDLEPTVRNQKSSILNHKSKMPSLCPLCLCGEQILNPQSKIENVNRRPNPRLSWWPGGPSYNSRIRTQGACMTKRIIRVGHSPDPDDAFMFYALAHNKIDTGDLEFRHELQDIETLNRRALKGELEVTAVSIHAYASLLDKYALLPSGCSMGDRYGPMVVAKRKMTLDELKNARIAVPGTLTTAFLALRLLLPGGFQYEVMPFDKILDAVA